MTVSHKLDSLQHAAYSSLNKPHHPSTPPNCWSWSVEWTSDQPSKSSNSLLTFHFSSKAWRGYVIKKKGTWNQIPTSNMKYSTPAWFAWQINVSRNFCNASMTLQSLLQKEHDTYLKVCFWSLRRSICCCCRVRGFLNTDSGHGQCWKVTLELTVGQPNNALWLWEVI